jgi:hypothetical protein
MSHCIPPGWVYAKPSYFYPSTAKNHVFQSALPQQSQVRRVEEVASSRNSSSVFHAGGSRKSVTVVPVCSPVSSRSLPEHFFIPPELDRIVQKPHWGDLGFALLKGEVEGTAHLTFNERLKIFYFFEEIVKSLPLGSCIGENDQNRLLMTAIEQFFAFQERERRFLAADCVADVFSTVIGNSFP